MATKKLTKKRPAKKQERNGAQPDTKKKKVGLLDNANQQIRNVQNLLESMHQPQPDLKAAERLAVESAKLEQAFSSIRKSAEDLQASKHSGSRALAQLQKASPRRRTKTAVSEVETESAVTTLFGIGGPRSDESTALGPKLTDIFALVANGLLDAQKALDKQSLDYVSQISDPRIAPALFAIPSVKAAAKFALAVDNQSNILVKLFGSPNDKTNYSESTLSFDIVTAPPPPDGLNPVPSFLVVGEERARVIQKATGTAPSDDVRARATVFRVPQVAANPYLLILNGGAAGAPVQVFRLSLDPENQPTVFNVPDDPSMLAVLADILASLKQWEKTARGANPGG